MFFNKFRVNIYEQLHSRKGVQLENNFLVKKNGFQFNLHSNHNYGEQETKLNNEALLSYEKNEYSSGLALFDH